MHQHDHVCRLPLYYEVKIALVFWLANLGGAEYVYTLLVQPLLLEHEATIDEGVFQARTWLHAHVQNNIGWCALVVVVRCCEQDALNQSAAVYIRWTTCRPVPAISAC
jgi:hypothetical protein